MNAKITRWKSPKSIYRNLNASKQQWSDIEKKTFLFASKVAVWQEQKLVSSCVGHFIIFFLNVIQNCTLNLHYLSIPNLYGIQLKRHIPRHYHSLQAWLYHLLQLSATASKSLISFSFPEIKCQSMNFLFVIYFYSSFKVVHINLLNYTP